MAAGSTSREREELGRALYALRGAATALARRALGDESAAEEACAEAYLRVLAHPESLPPVDGLRPWFLRAVLNAARRQGSSEAARRRREGAFMSERSNAGPAEEAERRELAARAVRALQALEERFRLPLALHYEQGLSLAEVAAVLAAPAGTVKSDISRGLERLRERLAADGVGAAPAAIVGALAAQAQEPIPAALSARIQELIAARLGPDAAVTGAKVPKGGLIVKIGLGVAAAGLVAGTALWAAGGLSEEAKPPVEPKPKFDMPVWHPDVRWVREKEPYGGSGLRGQLDGPLREGMWGRAPGLSALTPMPENGPYAFKSFDAERSRIHQTVGGASGYLDGPLARARFGVWGYANSPAFASSPNGRFHFFLDKDNKCVIRRIDLAEQVVTTFMPANWKTSVLLPADDGGLQYLLDGALVSVDAHGKPGKKVTLAPGPAVGGKAMDSVHNRLYASITPFGGKSDWYVWYWDLSDGSFHGVLPKWKEGDPKRGPGGMGGPDPGPYKGTSLYPEMSCFWGPDDPERNFLYLLPNDTSNFYRLDLKKEEIWCASIDGGEIRIIGTGQTKRIGADFCGWLPDGSFISSDRPWTGARIWRFRRTK